MSTWIRTYNGGLMRESSISRIHPLAIEAVLSRMAKEKMFEIPDELREMFDKLLVAALGLPEGTTIKPWLIVALTETQDTGSTGTVLDMADTQAEAITRCNQIVQMQLIGDINEVEEAYREHIDDLVTELAQANERAAQYEAGLRKIAGVDSYGIAASVAEEALGER